MNFPPVVAYIFRLRRIIQQINRRQWLMIALLFIMMTFYSWRKTVQFDGGAIMRDMEDPRPLSEYRLRPWKVEKVLKHGECGFTRDTMSWGMVTIVKSTLKNADRRQAIRETWGGIRSVGGALFRVVFIVGDATMPREKAMIERENEVYGDILMYNLPDTRRFLSDKIVAGMQWASEVLSPPWLYSSTDDDFLLHPPHLTSYLTTILDHTSHDKLPVICVYNYQEWDSPDRDVTSKWFCSSDLYPGWYWPPYCRGGMYVTSSGMVKRLFDVSRRTPYLHLDDVWITGLMRRKLGGNDTNIIPGPMSQRYYRRFLEEQDPRTVLVQHMWGNVQIKKVVSVSEELVKTWKKWQSTMRDAPLCVDNKTEQPPTQP